MVRPGAPFIMMEDGLEIGRGYRLGEPVMDILIHTAEQACVLVTLTFILAQTGSFARPRRQIGSRGQVAAIVLFLIMAFTEEILAQRHRPMNARIIASCAAGLLAGPAAGAAVGLGSALLAYAFQPTPLPGFGLAMVAGGLAGGAVERRRPAWVLRPATGFALGLSASLLRYALAWEFSACSAWIARRCRWPWKPRRR